MKYNKIVHVYDDLSKTNVTNMEINAPFTEPHPQLWFCSMGEKYHTKQKLSEIDFENNKDTLYCYIVEPYGDFGYFIGITQKGQVPVIEKIRQDIIDKLNNIPNFYFMIQTKHEGTYHDSDFQQIQNQLIKKKIPLRKTILNILTSWYVKDVYNSYLKRIKSNDPMIISLFPTFFIHKGEELVRNNFYDENNIENYLQQPREKLFLYYNRRIRKPHRIILLLLMYKHNMFDNNLVSYNLEDFIEEKQQMSELDYGAFTENKDEYSSFLSLFSENDWNTLYPKFKETKRRLIDVEDWERLNGFGYEFPETYLKSYISIVSESMFFEPHRYNSEKPYKSMAHFHPFILVGGAYTLKNLKEQGFKTFDKWWDESYDNELDNNKRLLKIWKLICELNNKSLKEIHQMYQEMIPTLIHNYKVLKNAGLNMKDLYKKYYDDNIIQEVENYDKENN